MCFLWRHVGELVIKRQRVGVPDRKNYWRRSIGRRNVNRRGWNLWSWASRTKPGCMAAEIWRVFGQNRDVALASRLCFTPTTNFLPSLGHSFLFPYFMVASYDRPLSTSWYLFVFLYCCIVVFLYFLIFSLSVLLYFHFLYSYMFGLIWPTLFHLFCIFCSFVVLYSYIFGTPSLIHNMSILHGGLISSTPLQLIIVTSLRRSTRMKYGGFEGWLAGPLHTLGIIISR